MSSDTPDTGHRLLVLLARNISRPGHHWLLPGCTPVCSKIFDSNETMPNENKHNDIKQNRQYVERKIYRSDTLKNTNI